jgi:hypothetical protein
MVDSHTYNSSDRDSFTKSYTRAATQALAAGHGTGILPTITARIWTKAIEQDEYAAGNHIAGLA